MEIQEEDNQTNNTSDMKNDSEQQGEGTMPPNSPWHFLISKYIPIWKFDEQNIIRINLTREVFSPFYFCHALITLSYIYYYKVLSHNIIFQEKESNFSTIIFYSFTFFYVMTNLCYIVTHFTNPGILPFNWSNTKQRFYTKNELRSGFAINHEQKRWGKMHDWPSRSFFAGDYGAIVLRADHYCIWINHFIGLKNHKFFIQSLFYCSSYLIEYIFILYKVYKNDIQIRKTASFYVISFFCFAFAYHHIFNFCDNIIRTFKNITTCEKLIGDGENSIHDKGVVKNFEEIFGSIYLFPLWFFPVFIPLPVDGFNYPIKQNDVCLAKNRSQAYINMNT